MTAPDAGRGLGERIARRLHTYVCGDDGEVCCWTEEGERCADVDLSDMAAVLVTEVEAEVAAAKAETWDEAGELADSVVVLWAAVPGLHPTAPEPHPAAIAATGARRTLVVLRSRLTEAFNARAARLAATQEPT